MAEFLEEDLQALSCMHGTRVEPAANSEYALTSELRLTVYQPMTPKAVMSSHKPIRIYIGNFILGIIP